MPPSFNTILIRRKNNERPPGKALTCVGCIHFLLHLLFLTAAHCRVLLSRLIGITKDFELRLRPLCQKIRIVDKLNGNPHLMVAGSPSVAVRMYNIHDIQRLEKELSDDNNNHDDANGGVDGLQHFHGSYEHSIVFFILPSNHQRDQLSRRESFFHLAQRTNNRIVIVADLSQAISAIASVVQSLAPEKREKKRKYFAQIAEQNYLPSSMGGGGGIEPTQGVIANYAKKAIVEWAKRMEMQRGDVNVALDMLGSIANVVTASNNDLDNIPITATSKATIRQFFGGIARDEREGADGNNQAADLEVFDDIDDSELLNIPDPSPNETSNQHRESSYDEFDLPSVGHGHSTSYQRQTQARDFYTPINPSFARRRLDQGHQQDHDAPRYGYPSNDNIGMSFNAGHYPAGIGYHQGEYDDYVSRQYTNQFM